MTTPFFIALQLIDVISTESQQLGYQSTRFASKGEACACNTCIHVMY
jgi:hypothetical protein